MKILINFILTAVFTCFLMSVNGQRLHDWIILGDQAINSGDPGGALYYYQKAMAMDSSQGFLNYKYAEALRLNHRYSKAAYHYNKVYSRERGKLFPLGGYWLAQMQKQAGRYSDSKRTWRRVRDQYQSDTTSFFYKKALQELRSIDIATDILADTQRTKLGDPGNFVNTAASEFAGIIDNDGSIIFSSLRGSTDEKGEIVDPSEYLIRLYRADSTSVSELIPNASFAGKHLGNLSKIPDTKRIFFSVCDEQKVCSVYKGILNENSISEINEIKNLVGDSLYSYSQPAAAVVDGISGLFVVSNQTAGSERTDIYWCPIDENGKVLPPQNVGAPLNTIGNEITPFYDSETSSLYFSSDWHYGLGGFDIFNSSRSSGNWGRPENIGLDFNSFADDVYFSLNAKIHQGLLSSNRGKDPCCSDLYLFDSDIPILDTLPEIVSLEDLNKYLPVTLYFHNDEPNPRSRDTTTTVGYLDTYYRYTALLPKYELEYSEGLSEAAKDAAEEEMDRFFLTEVDQGVEDLDLFSRLLLRELKNGAHVEMTIQAFASPLAKTDYNLRLSARRIQSLVNYFSEYDNGAFKPYMAEGEKSQLVFSKIPFGEYSAATTISDNPNENDAVYGIAAARERRIQIIEVGQSVEDSIATIAFDSQFKTISDTGKVEFHIKNNGSIALHIDSTSANLSVDFHLSSTDIAPGNSAVLTVKLKSAPETREIYQIEIFSNAIGGPRKLSLVFDPKNIDQK